MTKTILYEAKYSDGTEVKTLVGKNIKDGLIFSDSKGIVKSFDNKKNTYRVSVTSINGDSLEGEYKEEELILADLSSVNFNDEVINARELNASLSKKNLIITSIGCVISIILVAIAIVCSIVLDNVTAQIIILAVALVLIIAMGAVMLVLTGKNTKLMKLSTKRIEKIALEEQAKSESERSSNNELFDKIDKLKTLYDSGRITEEEYKIEKHKILEEITK